MRTRTVVAVVAGLGLAAGGPVTALSSSADLHRDFTGVVTSVERPSHGFALRTAPRRTVHFVVNARTRWSAGCRGLACVQVGRRLEVHARPAGSHWVALEVARLHAENGVRIEVSAARR